MTLRSTKSTKEDDKMFEEWHADDSIVDGVANDVGTSSETHMLEQKLEVLDAADHISKEPSSRIKRTHLAEEVIGRIEEGIRTKDKPRINYREMLRYVCYTSPIEPKNAKEALLDEYWINAMQEELEQFVRNDVWVLVPRPKDSNVFGTQWIFKNKIDENGNITRNKARLVVQG